MFIFLAACNACSEAFMDEPEPLTPSQELLEADSDASSDTGPDPSDVYLFPGNSCVQCQWYYCPPLDSVWQKQICIDHCVDPPAVL